MIRSAHCRATACSPASNCKSTPSLLRLPGVFIGMDFRVSQDLVFLSGAEQIQRPAISQLPPLPQEIGHHTPLVVAAEYLQDLLNSRQHRSRWCELPLGVMEGVLCVSPVHDAVLRAAFVQRGWRQIEDLAEFLAAASRFPSHPRQFLPNNAMESME